MREKFQREQQRREELRLARIRAAEEAAELSKAHRAQLELHEASLQKIIDLRIANLEREAKLLERVEKLADGLEQLLARANRDPIP